MYDEKTRLGSHNGKSGDEQRQDGQFFWSTLATMVRWRRFIAATTGFVAVAAVVISLLLPNWYRASARVLAPESGSMGSIASALMQDLPSAASMILGGSTGEYTRYLTILSSRRMYEAVVDSFDLVHVYDLADAAHPREAAIAELQKNVEFPVDAEYEYLSVEVLDRSPQRAADMANFFVHRLNEINSQLASQNAGEYRRFVEQRYNQVEAASDSLMSAVQRFQKKYGVFDVSSQMEEFFKRVADLRADAIQAEIRYQSYRSQLGPDNPEVKAFQSTATFANQKYENALAGQEQLMPVSQSEMSSVLRQYLELQREGEIQARVLEVMRPMLEQARFDEQKKIEALQIVDKAVPPVKKSRPMRTVIVLAAILSAFMLAVAFVLAYEWWRRNHAYVAYRLSVATEQASERTQPVERT
ncbi:MAG TPA: GNVR domain-containing protein [Rhodothermales bacterium]|nr:GNVR domain-containing protein [Rhodothermales bacterium]